MTTLHNNALQLTRAARCARVAFRSWGQSLRAALAAERGCWAGFAGRKRVTALLLLSMLPMASGCGAASDPPTLESFEIWDGAPGSVNSQRVIPATDGSIALRLDRLYTGRALLRTSARVDRCIYRVFSYTWSQPSRSFNCTPETSERMVVDEALSTARSEVAQVADHRITISVAEYDVGSRSELSRYTSSVLSVVFTE